MTIHFPDVSFESYSPNRVYKYIKYPESLRATLLQISNGILLKEYIDFFRFHNYL
jgi:hypothetical protein